MLPGATARVQKLRSEYWEKVKHVDPENLVFLDEMGVLLGLTRTYARSPHGTRVYDLKPFYRGAKVRVIGAISCKQVLAVMTLNGSMDGDAKARLYRTMFSSSVMAGCCSGDG